MGNKHVICEHLHLELRHVKGPTNQTRFLNAQMSFVMEFGHVHCANCNMDCYVFNTHGPTSPKWEIWHPSGLEEEEGATERIGQSFSYVYPQH